MVELVVVVVVIIGLAFLVVATHSGIQSKNQNNKRELAIQVIQGQLDAFFQTNGQGYYPSLANMNDAKWLAKNMKNLDQNVLIDPASPTKSRKLVAAPAVGAYAYQATQADGKTACETDPTTCVHYTVTATYEGKVNGKSTVSQKDQN
jgi:type II secretory pathway pseudopilin PulG